MEEAIQLNGDDLFIQSYAEGNSLDQMAATLGLSLNEVKKKLFDYKKVSMPGRGKRTDPKFEEVVYTRFTKIKNKKGISYELDMAETTVHRITKKFEGKCFRKKPAPPEYMVELDWDNLHTCPICERSDRVNDLTSNFDDMQKSQNLKKTKSSYCVRCETEWIERSGKYYEIDWDTYK